MKKLLLLFAAALFCLMSFADETVFSYTLPAIGSATLDDYKAGMGENLTATGGTIKFGNTEKFETRSEVGSNPAFKLDGDPKSDNTNTKYVLLNLSGALTAGDVIAVKGFSTSSTGYVFKLSDTRDAASSVVTEGNCVKSLTTSSYTVASNDCLVGKTAIYVTRNNTSLYFYSVEITRATTDPDAPTLEEIEITGELTAEAFYEGADMDYSGLSVVGTYDNEETETITSGITWSIAPALAEGTTSYTITAAVGELTATKNVTLTVSAVVLSQIKIEGYLHTPAYYTGSTLSLSGLQVNAYYSDNSKVDVTSQAGLTADVTTLTETVDVNFSAAFEGKTATKELNVYVCDPASAGATVLLSYNHAAALPTGVLVGGTTALGKAKMNVNKNEYDVIQLKNGYTKDNAYNGNSIKLVVDGGFQAGDEIIVSAYYNNSTEFKEAQVTLFTLNEDNSVHTLQTMGQAINGRYMAATPFECVYVLESAIADTLYIGRSGGTTLGVYTIKVQRPAVELTPFQQALKAIEEGAAESVEFTAILVSVSGTNYVVKEETTAVANPAPMKRIAAEDAEPTITLINPTVLNSAGNEPTEAGTRVAITGTTDATGIINGTIKAVNEKGWATGVDNTEAQKVEKIFRNGQVVIIKNGVEYNVLGAKL